MSKVKNQHYVPRFYLRHFCAKNETLIVFDKTTQKSFLTSIENIANENYFYDSEALDKASGKEQFLEKFFHPLEGDIASILKRLIADLESGTFHRLTKEDQAKLAIFLTYQFLRTKEKREEFKQIMRTVSKTLIDAHLRSLGKEDAQYEIHTDEASFQASFLLKRDVVEEFANILNRHIWIIVKNESGKPFYTSDHPFVKKARVKHPILSMEGIASMGIEIAFPIHPKYCLLLAERTYFENIEANDGQVIVTTDQDNVTYYNAFQVMQSYRQIYCNQDDFELAKRILSDNAAYADRERVRFEANVHGKPKQKSLWSRGVDWFRNLMKSSNGT